MRVFSLPRSPLGIRFGRAFAFQADEESGPFCFSNPGSRESAVRKCSLFVLTDVLFSDILLFSNFICIRPKTRGGFFFFEVCGALMLNCYLLPVCTVARVFFNKCQETAPLVLRSARKTFFAKDRNIL